MVRTRFILLLVLVLGLFLALGCGDGPKATGGSEEEVMACEEGQFAICHTKGDEPKTLCRDTEEELEDHLEHGDYEGECEDEEDSD